jgi:glycolate oxidase FAD binding subunit
VARWVTAPAGSDPVAHELVQRVVHSQLVPTALELDRPSPASATLAVLVEGNRQGVAARVDGLLALLGAGAEVHESAPEWWGRVPWADGEVGLRLTHEIAGLPRLLDAIDDISDRHGLRATVRGSAGVGLLYAALPGTIHPETVAAVVGALREKAPGWNGDVVVLDAPAAVKANLDGWGPVRGLGLMRRVKDQFDPECRLAPGRFVGGI